MTTIDTLIRRLRINLLSVRGRIYLFSFGFIFLAVSLPVLAHQFHLAGQRFLPLHFFTLLAGLAFGYQSGLIVGILSPIMSFLFSGMPPAPRLPIIIPEVAIYGLISGILIKRLNSYLTLFISLIAGRVVILIAAFLTTQSPFNYLLNSIRIGAPGILLQFLLVPILAQRLKIITNPGRR